MKRLITLLFIVFGMTGLRAQGLVGGNIHPVDWSGTVQKEADGSYNLIFKADIKDGWHIFSQFTPEGGSLPMLIKYMDDGQGYQTNGKTKESKTEKRYNKIFGVDEIIFKHHATLTQNIKIKDPGLRYVKAQMSYQVCQESCINEEYYFVFDLKEETAQVMTNYDHFMAFGQQAKKEATTTAEKGANTNKDEQPLAGSSDDFSAAAMGGGSAEDNMISPVTWSAEVQKEGKQQYALVFHGKIKEGWHIFSQFTAPGGSLPMQIKFLKDSTDYHTNGKAKESKTTTRYNDVFGVEETIFKHRAALTQNVTIENPNLHYIKAQMSYQVCQKSCINEEYYFVFDVKKQEAEVFKNYDKFMAYGGGAAIAGQKKESGNNKEVEADVAKTSSGSPVKKSKSLWLIFWLSFLGGFAALLTPCVFPMIPLTVSFFVKQNKNKSRGIRNALLYGLFIVVIYVALGLGVTAIFGANSLHRISTSVTFNLAFFVLLVIFAASFLGAFEIVLPASWSNKVDKQADKGGIAGIFFMALALAIVSFSCTVPVVGGILVQAISAGGFSPAIGMLGFSLALAIPFALFAFFPGWLNSLPKSGGWLNTVKVFLGFLELAFAFKFLSSADLVMQTHLLPREVFIAIWIAVFGCMAFYLFGKIQLPNDSKPEHISVGRLGLGLLALAFTIYLIPGLWGAPLKIISGFPPPMTYSESPHGVGNTQAAYVSAGTQNNKELNAGAVPGPHDILAFRDYETGVAYARKVHKPVMLDFTGWSCVNCRKMEEHVWSKPKILAILKNDVVMISLYTDDKKELPKEEQYTSKESGRRIRTIGQKWSDFQITNYRMNAQPYYVLLSPQTEKVLQKPVGYTPDIDEYFSWLEKGIHKYKENSEPLAAQTQTNTDQ